MKSNSIQEMSWIDFKEMQGKCKLVIIPSGAVEVYGPHLPLGTDTLVAMKLAQATARQVNAVVGPPLWAGQSNALADFPGTLTIQAESFKAYLRDIVEGFIKWGMRDFLFINSHLGNVPVIEQLAGEFAKKAEPIRCAQLDTWRFVQNFCNGVIETGAAAHGHASETGTSLMLYLYPELCTMERAVETPFKTEAYPDIIQYKPFHAYTETGTLGDATVGSAEKGKELFNRMTDRIVSFHKEEWGTEAR